jgi:hypothetical protein
MANYSKSTNFATKDSLASGNPLKVIKGTELDDEFEDIETAVSTKADSASPTFTGTATIPTANITTANIGTADFGLWTVTETSNVLYFAYNGTNKMKLDGSGNLTVVGDITAFGSV